MASIDKLFEIDPYLSPYKKEIEMIREKTFDSNWVEKLQEKYPEDIVGKLHVKKLWNTLISVQKLV